MINAIVPWVSGLLGARVARRLTQAIPHPLPRWAVSLGVGIVVDRAARPAAPGAGPGRRGATIR